MKLFTLIQIAFVALFAQGALANPDSGLYDPLPPEGAAFVRFINLNGHEKGSRQSKANGKSYMYLEDKEISPYFVTKEGAVKAAFGDATHEFDVEEQKFYTIILKQDDETLLVIEDEANTNQAKSQINFYNLSSTPSLSLKAKGGKIGVIEDVEQGKAGFRQINPVKIDLSVANGDEVLFDAGDKTLERSETYSLFFVGKDNVVWVKSSTNTTK